MRTGNHNAVHQHAGFGKNGTTSGNPGLHGRHIAGHGAKGFAAHRHCEADFEQLHGGSFGDRVGSLNERGDVEGFDDAECAGGFRRLRAAEFTWERSLAAHAALWRTYA